MKQGGFTLIELAVTVGIMIFLTSVLILYSRSGEQQINLFKEQAKVINSILRAKSLAIQTFSRGEAVCGYGVHFDQASGNFIVFKDLSPTSNCSDADQKYSGPDENFETNQLANGLEFSRLDLTDIDFVPPDPKTILTPAPVGSEATIIISTPDGVSHVTIKVNNAGQVTNQ